MTYLGLATCYCLTAARDGRGHRVGYSGWEQQQRVGIWKGRMLPMPTFWISALRGVLGQCKKVFFASVETPGKSTPSLERWTPSSLYSCWYSAWIMEHGKYWPNPFTRSSLISLLAFCHTLSIMCYISCCMFCCELINDTFVSPFTHVCLFLTIGGVNKFQHR